MNAIVGISEGKKNCAISISISPPFNVFKSQHLKSINISLLKSNYRNKINSKAGSVKGNERRPF